MTIQTPSIRTVSLEPRDVPCPNANTRSSVHTSSQNQTPLPIPLKDLLPTLPSIRSCEGVVTEANPHDERSREIREQERKDAKPILNLSAVSKALFLSED